MWLAVHGEKMKSNMEHIYSKAYVKPFDVLKIVKNVNNEYIYLNSIAVKYKPKKDTPSFFSFITQIFIRTLLIFFMRCVSYLLHNYTINLMNP